MNQSLLILTTSIALATAWVPKDISYGTKAERTFQPQDITALCESYAKLDGATCVTNTRETTVTIINRCVYVKASILWKDNKDGTKTAIALRYLPTDGDASDQRFSDSTLAGEMLSGLAFLGELLKAGQIEEVIKAEKGRYEFCTKTPAPKKSKPGKKANQ